MNIPTCLSTAGPLTIKYTSDGSVQYRGLELFVSCVRDCFIASNIRLDDSVPQSNTQLAIVWDTNGAIAYQVEYGPHGFALGSGTTRMVDTNGITITGLTALTDYDVYVRSICDVGDTGIWVSATFTTAMCAATTEAYSYSSLMSPTTDQFAPIGYSYYQHSYVQTIIDSDLLSELDGDITAFAFNPYNTVSSNYFTHCDVYLANVSENTLTGFIHPDGNHVFVKVIDDDDFCFTSTGWQTHGFDTPFTWDGHSNILVSVNRRHGSWSDATTFNAHSTANTKTWYVYRDGTPYDPTTVSGGNGRYCVGDMKFIACLGSGCRRPAITSVTHNYEAATVAWTGTGTNYEISIKESVDTAWGVSIPVIGNSYTFTSLQAGTNYDVRIRQDCTADSLDYSDWVLTQFTTDVFQYTHIYVKSDANGLNNGRSWNDAFVSLNDALAMSDLCYQNFNYHPDIRVAAGIYYGDTAQSSVSSFTMVPGTNVYGGFVGNESDDYDLSLRDLTANPTILDGGNTRRVLYQSGSYSSDNSAVWDGFVIRNGYVSSGYGGGAYLCGGSTLTNCTITDNYAYYGGGVYMYYGGTVTNSIITNCSSYYGGGAYLYYGGTMSNSTITDCSSNYYGGAYLYNGARLYNCQVSNNTSSYYGAVYSYYGYVENCLISNNACNNYCSGLYINGGSVTNSTIVRNQATSNVPAVYLTYGGLYNSIVWGNSNSGGSSQLTISSGNVEGVALDGRFPANATTGLICLDTANSGMRFSPMFVQPTSTAGTSAHGGDWRLQAGSVCVNRGNNNLSTLATDLVGNERIQNDTVDLGCYESGFGSSMYNYDTIVYVKAEASGTGDGSSWANAVGDINEAQRIAVSFGIRTIWVAEGTYYGDIVSTDGAFTLVPSVNVYGGFVGNESEDYDLSLRDLTSHPTVLDGANARRVLYQQRAFSSDNSVVWDGFVIRNGYMSSGYGAGAYLYSGSTLSNCIITDCSSRYAAGAYLNNGGILFNCQISNNTSTYYGAVYNYYGNVENCLINNNTGNSYCSGLYIYGGSVINSTIVRNQSTNNLPAVYLDYGGLYNSIIWGNSNSGGSSQLTINSGNVNGVALDGCLPGNAATGIISLDAENTGMRFSPMFVQPTATAGTSARGGDWHLQEGSICVNRGNNTLPTRVTDLAGNARIQNDTVDLGCYESGFGATIFNYDTIVYVKAEASGTGDGSSWANAVGDINEAQRIAFNFGIGTVWVAEGIYYGDTLSGDGAFTMVPSVSVYGGFVGNEPEDYDLSLRDFMSHPTILDGANMRRVLYQSYNFNANTAVEWNGFTLRNGRTSNGSGGGVLMSQYAALKHCTITNNYAYYGGGVYLSNGGTVSNSTITDCSSYYGSGVYLSNGGKLLNSQVSNNTTSYYGAVYNSSGHVENCLVSNNVGSNYSSGIYNNNSGTITNSTIVRNQATSNIPAVYLYSGSLNNSIIWGNSNTDGSAQFTIRSGNIEGVAVDGCVPTNMTTGIICLDTANSGMSFSPKFVQPTATAGTSARGGDWRLMDGSICVNRGNNNLPTLATDFAGNVRIQNDTVDLGCYESGFGATIFNYDTIVYVKAEASGTGDGSSWTNAIDDINEAQRIAVSFGIGTVWVAEGVYYGDFGSTNGAFTMMPTVNVYGGFVGNESEDYDLSLRDFTSHPTILDGANTHRVLYQPFDFSASTAVEWNGFTLRNGRTNNDYGGGAYIRGYANLKQCIITNNYANYGGGVYAYGSTYSEYDYSTGNYHTAYTSKIENCQVLSNTSHYYGGGVYDYRTLLANVLVADNRSESSYGAGLYANGAYILNSTIVSNNSPNGYSGAGIRSANNYTNTVRNCIVWGNKSGYYPNNCYGSYINYYNCAIEGTNGYINLASDNDGNDPNLFYVRFNDPTVGDYSLHPSSSCIDMGDTTNDMYLLPQIDIAGNSRRVGGLDLGCYESNYSNTCPSAIGVTAYNVTHNGAMVTWTPGGTESLWAVRCVSEDRTYDNTITTDDTTYIFVDLQLNRTYRVYVRAMCDSGAMSSWSIPTVFTTLCDTTLLAPLSDFTAFSPADSTVIYSRNITLSWSAVSNATSYDVYIWSANASEPTTPTVSGLTSPMLSNYQLPNYTNGAEYKWRVIAWNECISKTSPILNMHANGLPDLHVSQITNSTPIANQTMTVQWTVVNDGNGNTPSGSTWNDYIWIVSDADVRLYDQHDLMGKLATVENLSALGEGESYTNSATVTIPSDFIGNYYLFVFSDQVDAYSIDFSFNGGIAPNPYTPSLTGVPYPYLHGYVHTEGSLPELNEHDNFFYKVINILPPPTPDLVVSHISHPTNTFSGNQVAVSWTVSNQGGAAATGSWRDAVYIQPGSASELDATSALFLGSYPHSEGLGIDTTYTNSANVTIPIDYMGDYTFIVTTDYNNSLYESIYEQNNTSFSTQPINVTLTPPADLTVTTASFPQEVSARGSYVVSYTVQNVGSSATYVNRWNDAIYLSSTPQIDTTARLLTTVRHSGVLSADSTYNVNKTVSIPADIVGQWYLLVKTDSDNDVFEYAYENNNVYSISNSSIVHVPDLAVGGIAVNDTAVSPGQQFMVSYTVNNVGSGDLVNANWRDALYMTQSPSFDMNSAVLLSSIRHSETVLADSSYNGSMSVTLSQDVLSDIYLWVFTDNQSNIFENGSEENNIGGLQQPITVLLPDLAVTSIDIPDTIVAGTTMQLSWMVKNIGQGDVLNRSFKDIVYVDGQQAFETSVNGISLNSGDSLRRTATIMMPCVNDNSVAIEVVTDVQNTVVETGNSENNTMTLQSVPIVAPDLSVTLLPIHDTLWSGQNYTLQYVVTNNGSFAVINRSVQDMLYFNSSASIYALSDSLARMEHRITLLPGQSDTISAAVTIPDGIEGDRYFHVAVNVNGSICESRDVWTNVAHGSSQDVHLSPWPDIVVSNVSAPAEVSMGEMVIVNYNLTNSGTANLYGQPFNVAVYYSAAPSTYLSSGLLYTYSIQPSIGTGESLALSASFTLPSTISAGNYYFFVVADASDVIYEHNSETNNKAHSQQVLVKHYPLDLMAESIQGDSEVHWGQQLHYLLTIKNNSTVPTLSSVWNDALYLSLDNTFDASDTRLRIVEHRSAVVADGTYLVDMTITIPMGSPESSYLIAVADIDQNNPDINQSNNIIVKPISVSPIPTPDLAVTEVSIVDDDIVSGQARRLAYQVSNVGQVDLPPTAWTDKLFLSSNGQLDNTDEEIGSSLQRQDTLRVGESYRDTLIFTVPLPMNGFVNLILKANANANFYETSVDNNTALLQENVTLPLPGDLVVRGIDADDSVVSGRSLTVEWYVRNIGENTLSGNGLRSLVYLSSDTVFDANDKLLGMTENNNINLGSGNEIRQSLTARVSGVPEGQYHLIVKTNVRNAFNEITCDNNTSYSEFPVAVSLRTLQFNTVTVDTLFDDVVSDFRLNVGGYRNETVRIHLETADSMQGAVNMIYVSHNQVGDNLHYDFSTTGQYTGNPELYIPATLPGYYGISLYGATPVADSQLVTISADIIPFELRSINPTSGGNTGKVTVELTGSRFRPDMKVWLAGTDTITPDTLIYVNYYKSYATFDLTGRDTGLYDVGVLNFCEGEALLADAFHIVEGVPDGLSYNLLFPHSPRPNRNIVMTLEFGNTGNVDITGAVLEVQSLGGTTIALTSEGLQQHSTTLRVPLTIDGEPEGLLRPGSYGTISIYGYTGGSLVFTINKEH